MGLGVRSGDGLANRDECSRLSSFQTSGWPLGHAERDQRQPWTPGWESYAQLASSDLVSHQSRLTLIVRVLQRIGSHQGMTAMDLPI